MQKVEKLYFCMDRIFNLEGLQYAANLEVLDLSHEDVVDLSLIKDLKKLYHLNISGTNITNIKCLESLESLETLIVSGTNIRDITSIKNFKNLKVLDISNTKLKDEEVIELLQIEQLEIISSGNINHILRNLN